MKVSIIGGSGFIGTRLSSRLFEKSEINFEILDLNKSVLPVNYRFCDVACLSRLRESLHADVIINLAAEHRDDVLPLKLYDLVNVQGARNICKVAEEANINKIIFTSSVAVYGFARPDSDESGPISPFNDYGRTKWEAEQIYKSWQARDSQNRTLVIIRPTVVFGEGNGEMSLIYLGILPLVNL